MEHGKDGQDMNFIKFPVTMIDFSSACIQGNQGIGEDPFINSGTRRY